MVSIWWLPLLFAVGVWSGVVAMAMLSMAASQSEHLTHAPRAR
jgi:hypothetical protein